MKDLNLVDSYDFHLPEVLIAQTPTTRRAESRLLQVNRSHLVDAKFSDLIDCLNSDDLLVLNDTKVMPARLLGTKLTGGAVEFLVERVLANAVAVCMIRSSKSPKIGTTCVLKPNNQSSDCAEITAVVTKKMGDGYHEIEFSMPMDIVLARCGHLPLPPYIQRDSDELDQERYQTVYAQSPGAVAAPTAGLHFDTELLEKIQSKGVQIGRLTLHVGSGTFKPIRSVNINQHVMHREWFSIDQVLIDQIVATRSRGGRVIAVGTTSLRALESCALFSDSGLRPMQAETQLFIKPGFKFNVVDVLITNFHLPKSTLLILVASFAGYERIMSAYAHAVAKQYRFFSYGDAMWLSRLEEHEV